MAAGIDIKDTFREIIRFIDAEINRISHKKNYKSTQRTQDEDARHHTELKSFTIRTSRIPSPSKEALLHIATGGYGQTDEGKVHWLNGIKSKIAASSKEAPLLDIETLKSFITELEEACGMQTSRAACALVWCGLPVKAAHALRNLQGQDWYINFKNSISSEIAASTPTSVSLARD